MLLRTSFALANRSASAWRTFALGLLVVLVALARFWVIRHYPEPDTDAPGHLGIARALLSDPTNVSIHWVYLPGYHFLLAGLLLLGLSADAIRIVNCALAALVPLVVAGYGATTADQTESGLARHVPWMAAVFCAISPLVNLLGTSAQQETLFTLLVLGAVWSIDLGRFALAGAVLGAAALIRYEAWGAVILLLGFRCAAAIPRLRLRLPEPILGAGRLPFTVVLPSVLAIGGWLLAHELREGAWFGVLRELYRYTETQRETFHRDLFWFPVQQPLYVFGSVIAVLFFAGLRRAWRTSHVIPLGIYLFLLAAYAFKGALGSARYYESLMPFVALSAAHGLCSVGARWRWIAPTLFLVASLHLLALSTQLFLWTWGSTATIQSAPAGNEGAHRPKPSTARAPAPPRSGRRSAI